MKRMRKKAKKTTVKAPLSEKELLEKIKTIRGKLQDMKEYKAILAEDGLKPDEDDKRRESELIVQLLRLEKQAGIKKEQPKTWRGKKPAGGKASGPSKSRSAGPQKKKSAAGPQRKARAK